MSSYEREQERLRALVREAETQARSGKAEGLLGLLMRHATDLTRRPAGKTANPPTGKGPVRGSVTTRRHRLRSDIRAAHKRERKARQVQQAKARAK